MRKFIFLVLFLFICFGCSVSYKFTPDNPVVYVQKNDGQRIISSQVTSLASPKIVDGQMMVPLSMVRDLVGGQLSFNAREKTTTWKFETPEIFFENYKFKERLLNLIKGAKKQIFVEVYILTNIDIIKALAAKQNSNVKVCVIIDDQDEDYFKKNTATYKANKLRVRRDWVADNRSIMHRKMCVIDSRFVTLGSSNWSLPGLNKEGYSSRKTTNINEEVNMVFDNYDLARRLEEQYYSDWRISRDVVF